MILPITARAKRFSRETFTVQKFGCEVMVWASVSAVDLQVSNSSMIGCNFRAPVTFEMRCWRHLLRRSMVAAMTWILFSRMELDFVLQKRIQNPLLTALSMVYRGLWFRTT